MRRLVPLMLLLVLLVPVSVAHASAAAVIRDCTDDEILQGHYTQKELANALAKLGADSAEYTNCAAVIHNAQLALASNPGGTKGGSSAGGGTTSTTPGGGTGTSTTPSTATPTGTAPGAFGGFSGYPKNPTSGASKDERAAIAEAQANPTTKQRTELAASTLPGPLIGALVAGGLGLLVLVLLDLRRRVLSRRG